MRSSTQHDFEIARNVGRLVEARVFRLATPEDVNAYRLGFADPALGTPASPVLCADHRPAQVYPPRVADQLVELFASLNSHWHRVALIVSPTNATLAMQLQRIVRDAANPSRRVFDGPVDAISFLSEVLDIDERYRLSAFLSQRPVSAKPRA